MPIKIDNNLIGGIQAIDKTKKRRKQGIDVYSVPSGDRAKTRNSVRWSESFIEGIERMPLQDDFKDLLLKEYKKRCNKEEEEIQNIEDDIIQKAVDFLDAINTKKSKPKVVSKKVKSKIEISETEKDTIFNELLQRWQLKTSNDISSINLTTSYSAFNRKIRAIKKDVNEWRKDWNKAPENVRKSIMVAESVLGGKQAKKLKEKFLFIREEAIKKLEVVRQKKKEQEKIIEARVAREKKRWEMNLKRKKASFEKMDLEALENSKLFHQGKADNLRKNFRSQLRKTFNNLLDDLYDSGQKKKAEELQRDYIQRFGKIVNILDKKIEEKKIDNKTVVDLTKNNKKINTNNFQHKENKELWEGINKEINKWRARDVRSKEQLKTKSREQLEGYIEDKKVEIENYQNNWEQSIAKKKSIKEVFDNLQKNAQEKVEQVKNDYIMGKMDLLEEAERLQAIKEDKNKTEVIFAINDRVKIKGEDGVWEVENIQDDKITIWRYREEDSNDIVQKTVDIDDLEQVSNDILDDLNNQTAKVEAEVKNLNETEKRNFLEGVANLGYWTQKTRSKAMGGIMSGMAKLSKKNNSLHRYFKEYAGIYKEDEERARQSMEERNKNIKEKGMGVAKGAGNTFKYGRVLYDLVDSGSARGLNPFRHVTAGMMFLGRSSEAVKRTIVNGEAIKEKTRIKDMEIAMEEAERIFDISLKENGSTDLSKKDLEIKFREQLPQDIIERIDRGGGIKGTGWAQYLFKQDAQGKANRILKKLDKVEKSKKSEDEKKEKKKIIMQKYSSLLRDLDAMVTYEGLVDNLAYSSRVAEEFGKTTANVLIVDSVARLARGAYDMHLFDQAWDKGDEYVKKIHKVVEKFSSKEIVPSIAPPENSMDSAEAGLDSPFDRNEKLINQAKNSISKALKRAVDGVLGPNVYDDIGKDYRFKIDSDSSVKGEAPSNFKFSQKDILEPNTLTMEGQSDDTAVHSIASAINADLSNKGLPVSDLETTTPNVMDKELKLNKAGVPVPDTSQSTPEARVDVGHVQAQEVIKPTVSSEQLELATIQVGRGSNSIEGVFIKQLVNNPEKFGFKGDITETSEVRHWAETQAHRIAMDNGYFDQKTGGGVRMRASSIDHNAYVLKNINGKIGVDEYLNEELQESHAPGVGFEDGNIEKNEYIHQGDKVSGNHNIRQNLERSTMVSQQSTGEVAESGIMNTVEEKVVPLNNPNISVAEGRDINSERPSVETTESSHNIVSDWLHNKPEGSRSVRENVVDSGVNTTQIQQEIKQREIKMKNFRGYGIDGEDLFKKSFDGYGVHIDNPNMKSLGEQITILKTYEHQFGITQDHLRAVGIDIRDGFSDVENKKLSYLIDHHVDLDKSVEVVNMANSLKVDYENIQEYYYQLKALDGSPIRQRGLLEMLKTNSNTQQGLIKIFGLKPGQGNFHQIERNKFIIKDFKPGVDIVVQTERKEVKFGLKGKVNWGTKGLFKKTPDTALTNKNIEQALKLVGK